MSPTAYGTLRIFCASGDLSVWIKHIFIKAVAGQIDRRQVPPRRVELGISQNVGRLMVVSSCFSQTIC